MSLVDAVWTAHALGSCGALLALGARLARVAPADRTRALRTWALAGALAAAAAAGAGGAWERPPTMSGVLAGPSATYTPEAVAPRSAPSRSSLPTGLLAGLGATGGLARLSLQAWRALRAVRASTRLLQVGRLDVRVSLDVPSPLALALPGRAVILLDAATATGPHRAVALRHEALHHRHADPAWAWAWGLAEAALWPNPLASLLVREARLAEEQRIDALVAGEVGAHTYASVLLDTAPTHHAAFPALRGDLPQRIDMLVHPATRRLAPLATLLAVTLLTTSLTWAATGSDAVSVTQVEQWTAGSNIPAEPAVARALERILRSPEARRHYARGIDAMEGWPELTGRLQAAGLPAELAAVPLVESGWRNLGTRQEPLREPSEQSRAPGMVGRGLWMFIPATARTYGLRVDDAVDERLDPARATDAAIRLLSDLHDQLGDWWLALSAYNQGQRAVQQAIDAQGARDVWALTESGALNGYAAEVAAAAILLRHPELLD